jgi:hypothetical protein
MMKGINDELILAARLLLATLFLIFGWRKVRDYSGTVVQMVQLGLPMPVPATIGSIFMELPVAFATCSTVACHFAMRYARREGLKPSHRESPSGPGRELAGSLWRSGPPHGGVC